MPPILGHRFALAQDFTALTSDHSSFLLKVQLKCNVFLLVDKIRNQIYVSNYMDEPFHTANVSASFATIFAYGSNISGVSWADDHSD